MEVGNLHKLVGRLIKIIKPSGVNEIEFELEPIGGDSEYYLRLTYVVPNDSKYLEIRKNDSDSLDRIRETWNRQIGKSIMDYFGIKIYINSSGIRSEQYHNVMKSYVK